MPSDKHRVRSALLGATSAVLSVAIAVAAAHALRLEDSWWAAISAIMVMQENFLASLYRGLLRGLGTLAGAAAAIALGGAAAASPVLFALLMGIATFGCLFAALVFRHSHAWVLTLVTFVMVLCEAVGPHADLVHFGMERVANVAVGTAACVLVAGLREIRVLWPALHRHRWFQEAAGPASGRLANTRVEPSTAALHALQGAIAMIALSVAVSLWGLDALAQGMVTTVAVLIVPLDAHGAAPRSQVTDRMLQRFVGCLLAGVVAFALFPLIEGRVFWCQLALALGVAAGTASQTLLPKFRYTAVQFMVAFVMVFVQDHGWTIEERPAEERLAGVVAGIVALYVVFLFFPQRARQS